MTPQKRVYTATPENLTTLIDQSLPKAQGKIKFRTIPPTPSKPLKASSFKIFKTVNTTTDPNKDLFNILLSRIQK
jgi:hypothetical protein